MSEIINLKRHRKRLAREEEELKAAENRARFGRSKTERLKADLENSRKARDFDVHQRES